MGRVKTTEPARFPEFQTAFNELMGDMTIKDFADKLGMSRATVGFYSAGQRIPDAMGIKTIAEKCEVSADWLLGISDIRTADTTIRAACEYTGLSESAIQNLHMESHDKEIISALSRLLENDFEELHRLDREIYLAMRMYQSVPFGTHIEKTLGGYLPEGIKDTVFKCLDEWGGIMLSHREAADHYAAKAAHLLQDMIENAAHGHIHVSPDDL